MLRKCGSAWKAASAHLANTSTNTLERKSRKPCQQIEKDLLNTKSGICTKKACIRRNPLQNCEEQPRSFHHLSNASSVSIFLFPSYNVSTLWSCFFFFQLRCLCNWAMIFQWIMAHENKLSNLLWDEDLPKPLPSLHIWSMVRPSCLLSCKHSA